MRSPVRPPPQGGGRSYRSSCSSSDRPCCRHAGTASTKIYGEEDWSATIRIVANDSVTRPANGPKPNSDPADHHRHRDASGIFVGLPSPLGAVMAIELRHGTKVWHRRERGAQFATWAAWLAGAAIFIYCWELISDKTIWAFVADAPTQAVDLAVRMVPPDWGFIDALWRPMWDTINIATLGTAMGTILAVPVAYCAARNTTPSVAFIRPAALFIIVSSRSINSLIWALMLVTIIGPGVFAGILALGLRSIGFCAKLLYEAIEEIDESQVEAVRATGASGAQVTAYGIVPQVLPAFAGVSVFRWDINIRESTVLGLVGAGGIGLPLNAAITMLAWTQVSLILLIIIATVVVSEWVSAKIRHAIT
jgi:phosphonate transport system permease protein